MYNSHTAPPSLQVTIKTTSFESHVHLGLYFRINELYMYIAEHTIQDLPIWITSDR